MTNELIFDIFFSKFFNLFDTDCVGDVSGEVSLQMASCTLLSSPFPLVTTGESIGDDDTGDENGDNLPMCEYENHQLMNEWLKQLKQQYIRGKNIYISKFEWIWYIYSRVYHTLY